MENLGGAFTKDAPTEAAPDRGWSCSCCSAPGSSPAPMNAAVGSGTLVTYPLLLAYGLPPVVANGTNTTGIAPGNVAGAWAYRRELAGRRRRRSSQLAVVDRRRGARWARSLVIALPSSVFETLVPWLILRRLRCSCSCSRASRER